MTNQKPLEFSMKVSQLTPEFWLVTMRLREQGKMDNVRDFIVNEHQLAFLNVLERVKGAAMKPIVGMFGNQPIMRTEPPDDAPDFGTPEKVIAGLDRINAHNDAARKMDKESFLPSNMIIYGRTEDGKPTINGVIQPMPKTRSIAEFHRAKHGTVCICGWAHGSAYNRELELEHRLEHLEGRYGLIQPPAEEKP